MEENMTIILNRAINEGYRAGRPVIVLSNEGRLLHGRKEAKACGRFGTLVAAVFVAEITQRDWNQSKWPEIMDAARRVYYRPPIKATCSQSSRRQKS